MKNRWDMLQTESRQENSKYFSPNRQKAFCVLSYTFQASISMGREHQIRWRWTEAAEVGMDKGRSQGYTRLLSLDVLPDILLSPKLTKNSPVHALSQVFYNNQCCSMIMCLPMYVALANSWTTQIYNSMFTTSKTD